MHSGSLIVEATVDGSLTNSSKVFDESSDFDQFIGYLNVYAEHPHVAKPLDGTIFSAPLILVGLVLCLGGYRFRRLFSFVLGALAGALITWWMVVTVSLTYLVAACGGAVTGTLSMLTKNWVSGATLGYIVGICTLMIDPVNVFSGVGRAAPMIGATLFGIMWDIQASDTILTVSSSVFGSLLVALGVDATLDSTFTTILFDTLGNQSTSGDECSPMCLFVVIIWGVVAATGILVQFLVQRYTSNRNLSIDPPTGNKYHPGYHFVQRSASTENLRDYDGNIPMAADYNYINFSALSAEEKTLAHNVEQAFTKMGKKFGFQRDNVRNQIEHVFLLLSNKAAKDYDDNAVFALYAKTFENYKRWCAHLNIEPHTFGEVSRLTSPDTALRDSFTDLALYYLIWGEAANLRHLPECLAFLYHKMATVRGTEARPGTFLVYSVKPIYDLLKQEKRKAAASYRTYDDMNEFFWKRQCLVYGYSMEPKRLDANEKAFTEGVMAHKVEQDLLSGLRKHCKTYVERRSWLHPLLSFFRVFFFYFIFFQFLSCIAMLSYYEFSIFSWTGIQVLLSLFVTLSFLYLTEELLSIWISYDALSRSLYTAVGFFIRLVLKATLFCALAINYEWFWRSSRAADTPAEFVFLFLSLASLYMIPLSLSILGQIVPQTQRWICGLHRLSFLRPFVHFWYPNESFLQQQDLDETFAHRVQYQLFWLTLLLCKFTCSYYTQILPLAQPTVDLWVKPQYENILFPNSHIFLMFTLWIPFFLVFVLDVAIWFAIWTAIVGGSLGIAKGLGDTRSFRMLKRRFLDLSQEFGRKFLQTDEEECSRVASDRQEDPHTGLLDSSDRQIQQDEDSIVNRLIEVNKDKFAVVWNHFIQDLRARDLISDEERDLLKFNRVQPRHKGEFMTREVYLPMFLKAGAVDAILRHSNHVISEAASDSSTPGTLPTKQAEQFLMTHIQRDPVLMEALELAWSLTRWILRTLFGHRHADEMEVIESVVLRALAERSVLSSFKIEGITPFRNSLVDLIRLLSVALGRQKTSLNQLSNAAENSDVSLMKKVHSVGTLSLLAKLHNATTNVLSGDVKLLRQQARVLLGNLRGLPRDRKSIIGQQIDRCMAKTTGFFYDDSYAQDQVDRLLSDQRAGPAFSSMRYLLQYAELDARPQNREATRRLLEWVNSVFMRMPKAPPVKEMRSMSTLTPFYAEDIVYAKAELLKETGNGVSPIKYLKTIYPEEWTNLLERIGVSSANHEDDVYSLLESDNAMQVQLWATLRGQTLFRTVSGIMQYERAIRVLAELEQDSEVREDLMKIVEKKFTYVVSCQIYGKHKRTNNKKAEDTEFLLACFPNLRIAYIDTIDVPVISEQGEEVEVQEHYSVLIKGVRMGDKHQVREVYRLKLPGNPILGEGKPENQNHALVFTRGEFLQTIDMNQDNYFEEALKLRNLLEEFKAGKDVQPVTILGFKEHIFTGSLSSIANYMALQEGVFVSLGQRILNNPLRIRMHYGHPDVFDKLFFLQRGGVSKASKGINLSEDIFAGYRNTLRGGTVEFREYMQAGKGRDVGLQQLFQFEAKLAQGAAEQSLSRDVARLADGLDFCRLLSFYHGGIGFYIANSLTIWAIYLFIWAKLFYAMAGFRFIDQFAGVGTLSYWFGMFGFLTTLPIVAMLGVERGFRRGILATGRMLFTGGPLFFLFHMATKSHFFEQTLLAGGAKYRPTGRGFVTKHESFAEIYRFHSTSHFSKSIELCGMLSLCVFFSESTSTFFAVTWPLWLIALSWTWAPFWFNPIGFGWDQTVADAADWQLWMYRVEGGANLSWATWWKEDNEFYSKLTMSSKVMLTAMSLRFAAAGVGVLYATGVSTLETMLCCAIMVYISLVATCLEFPGVARFQRTARFSMVIAVLIGIIVPISVAGFYNATVIGMMWSFVAVVLAAISIIQGFVIFGFRSHTIIELHRMYHWAIGALMFIPLGLLALLYFPAKLQTRLTFYNAFSKGVIIENLLKGQKTRQASSLSDEISSLQDIIQKQQQQIEALQLERRTAMLGIKNNGILNPAIRPTVNLPAARAAVPITTEEKATTPRRPPTLVGSPISTDRGLNLPPNPTLDSDARPIPATVSAENFDSTLP